MSPPSSTLQPNSTTASYSQPAFTYASSHSGTGSLVVALSLSAPPRGNPRTRPWRLRGLSSRPVSARRAPSAHPSPMHQGRPQRGGLTGRNGGDARPFFASHSLDCGDPSASQFSVRHSALQLEGPSGPSDQYHGPIPTAATRTSSYVASIRTTPSTPSMTFTHTSDEAYIETANKIISMGQKIKSLAIDLAKQLDKFKSVNGIGADKTRAIDSAMRALSDEIVYVYSATPSTDDIIHLIEKVSAEFDQILNMINGTELTAAMAGVRLESDENEDIDCEASLATLIAALQL